MRETTDNLQAQFIPQLQLWYDPVRKIYLTPDGSVANVTTNPVHPSVPQHHVDDNVADLKFDASTVVKIVGFVAALAMQYAILITKIDDNAEKIQATNSKIEQTEKSIKELGTNFNKLESQVTISTELINQLQIHMTNDRKK
jgi:hypothetical protein